WGFVLIEDRLNDGVMDYLIACLELTGILLLRLLLSANENRMRRISNNSTTHINIILQLILIGNSYRNGEIRKHNLTIYMEI
ncbi:hypothetical protein L9F63_017163, partial [Diploptera punctata]